MAQNLKCVVQHHSVGLINVFKQDLVGFANELWGNGAITEAVKDGILDSSKGGVDLRASNLVSSICKSLSVLQNLSGQSVHHMTCLLHVLEKAGESILANNMRIELASMGVDLPPYYSATSISETSDKREESELIIFSVWVFCHDKNGPPRSKCFEIMGLPWSKCFANTSKWSPNTSSCR